MPRYLVHRALGDVTEQEIETAAEVSRRVRVEQFPQIEWEHSHVVRTDVGFTVADYERSRAFCAAAHRPV